MHKHFDVLTTSSLFLSVRMKFPHNPRIFTSCFAFNSLAFSTERTKKKICLKTSCTCKCCRRSFIHSKHKFHWIPFLGFSCYGVKNPAML